MATARCKAQQAWQIRDGDTDQWCGPACDWKLQRFRVVLDSHDDGLSIDQSFEDGRRTAKYPDYDLWFFCTPDPPTIFAVTDLPP